MKTRQIESAFGRIVEQYYKRDILPPEKDAIAEMVKTYSVFDNLRQQRRELSLDLRCA